MDKQSLENITDTIKREIENIENDNYYEIKKYFSNLLESIEEQKSYNLLLQKQITSLKKEKVDIMTQISQWNSKLDDIEKDLGINLNMKRGKKK
jgi:predicted  nucleic acid-binding Zn-ribbon protein